MKTTDIDCINESELSEVINLRRLSFLAIAPKHYNPRELENLIADYDVAQFASMVASKSFFCVRTNRKIIATAGWSENRLQHVYVDPTSFGCGIGSKMVDYVVEDYFQQTVQTNIQTNVVIYAQEFFEKCGFKVLSKETAWDGSPYLLMGISRQPKMTALN